MKKTRLLMLLAALCVTVVSHAQVAGLLGTVTDESGEPISRRTWRPQTT